MWGNAEEILKWLCNEIEQRVKSAGVSGYAPGEKFRFYVIDDPDEINEEFERLEDILREMNLLRKEALLRLKECKPERS